MWREHVPWGAKMLRHVRRRKELIVHLIARILRKLIRGIRCDCMVIIGITQAYPVKLESQSNTGQMKHSTVVIF